MLPMSLSHQIGEIIEKQKTKQLFFTLSRRVSELSGRRMSDVAGAHLPVATRSDAKHFFFFILSISVCVNLHDG